MSVNVKVDGLVWNVRRDKMIVWDKVMKRYVEMGNVLK
jgi:hypothetical protein